MEIREVDTQDQELVRRHWEIGKAAEDAHRPYDFYWPWESARAIHSHPRPDTKTVLLGAFEDGVMRGAGQVDHPLHDNTHVTYAEFFVHPVAQRRGIGRALVQAGCDVARDNGRRVMMVEAYAPVGEDSTALKFARALGFEEALEEAMKVVDLPATEHMWAAMAAAAAAHHAGYRLATWHDVVPGEFLDGYCRLQQRFNGEAPMGELDLEAERWDEKRVRAREERFRRAGRGEVCTVALAPDGTVVGLTEATVSTHSAHHGMQGGTLVLQGHRGHRLGMAMKVANQQALRARFTGCQVLLTGNASSNAPMNAVNERLGFRAVERCLEVQRKLAR